MPKKSASAPSPDAADPIIVPVRGSEPRRQVLIMRP